MKMIVDMIAEYQRVGKLIDKAIGVDINWLGEFTKWFEVWMDDIVPKDRKDREVFMEVFFNEVESETEPEECAALLRKYIDEEISFDFSEF